MIDTAELLKLNNDPLLFQLRRSERNLNKPIAYKPMLSFNASKKKIKRTITYFLKTNITSKKRKV